jgi:hypothetical protein
VAITVTNINTGGAQVIIGGVVNAADGDGFYIGLASGGNNIGATTGGVTITYTVDITEIF